jgi:hypothetical protein
MSTAAPVLAFPLLHPPFLTRDAPYPLHDRIHQLLADRVVAARIVVCGILAAADEKLRVEERLVLALPDLVDRRRVQVDKDGARHVLAVARLGEERVVRPAVVCRIVVGGCGLAPVGAQAVLEEVAVRGEEESRGRVSTTESEAGEWWQWW